MKAVFITEAGGIDKLVYGDVPDPKPPAEDEVLVRVRACAVNRVDLFTREGSHGMRPRSGQITGLDLAGDVAAVGADVKGFKIGDRVMGTGTSTYAQYALSRTGGGVQPRVGLHGLALIPDGLAYEEAAAVPTAFCAAWHCIVCKAHLGIGETVLVIAGGSGVGSAAIQIAKAMSARVITTAGTDEKVQKAKALGADEAINHAREDFSQRVKELTGGEGVDLVYDHVGQATWEKSIASLKQGGRYVTNGVTSGHLAQIHLGRLWTRDLSVLGTTMQVPEDLGTIARLVARKVLRPVVDRVLPLSEAGQAHAILESGNFFGKVVLRVP